MGGEKEVCTNRCVIVGSLWAQREIEGQGEGEGEREGEGKADGGVGERDTEREGEGEEEEEEGGEGRRVLWALGGNLCLAFEGWGSYIITLL